MNRMIHRSLGAGLVLLIAVLASWSVLEARVSGLRPGPVGLPDPPLSQDKRAELMALKLVYAKNVLEGLSLQNMDLVAENARDLKLLSAAAEWEPATVPGPLYLDYTREFQRIANSLSQHAKEENLDAATLSYVQLTMNCIECHKYVRAAAR